MCIELLGFDSMEGEWVDILGSGAVLKQVIRESHVKPMVCPEYKQKVVVHLIGRTQGPDQRTFQNTREENKPITAFVGDQIMDLLPPGLMLAVRMMGIGELARVKLESRYAYGTGAHWFGLNPDENVEYEVELLNIGDYSKEVPEMSQDELKETVIMYKNRGNDFFKWKELDKALRCYKEGVRFGDGAFQQNEENIKLDEDLLRARIDCLNNIATVLEKQGKLKEAMETTILVLESDPSHLKALTRAARIAVMQGSHEEAEAAVKAALIVAPKNEVVLQLKRDLEERIENHKAKEKERYGGFLKPVSGEQLEKIREAERLRVEKLLQEQEKNNTQNNDKTEEREDQQPEVNVESSNHSQVLQESKLAESSKIMLPKEEEAQLSEQKPAFFKSREFNECFIRIVVLCTPSIIFGILLTVLKLFFNF